MKAEVFTGAAQRVNTDHYYATENNALITAAVFLLMYYRLGMKTTRGVGLGPTESGLFCWTQKKLKIRFFPPMKLAQILEGFEGITSIHEFKC